MIGRAGERATVDAFLDTAAPALLDGDRDRAVGCLAAAVTAYRKLGYRFDAARAGLALARACLRAGRRTELTTWYGARGDREAGSGP